MAEDQLRRRRSALTEDEQISALRAEIERLKSSPSVTLGVTRAYATPPEAHTMQGAEEMLLQLAPDDTIGYLNAPMAKLLGIEDRKLAIGVPVDNFDRLGLTQLAQVSRNSEETHVLERPFDVESDRLPAVARRPAGMPILRMIASAVAGRVHVVVQDVSLVRWLESTFGRYVSPAVIERMRAGGRDPQLMLERSTVTILVADLRGFTAVSQELRPEAVGALVNSFLGPMAECIEALEGTIDKYVGDEIIALFGAPHFFPDHALRALICAAQMQRRHQDWMEARTREGAPAPGMSIGLATGEALVGHVGPPSRMEYTAIGRTVSLAERLCSAGVAGSISTMETTHSAALASLGTYQGKVPVPHFSFGRSGDRIEVSIK